jgi:hypothetical protein
VEKITCTVDSSGRIVGLAIITEGTGYTSEPLDPYPWEPADRSEAGFALGLKLKRPISGPRGLNRLTEDELRAAVEQAGKES